MQSFAKKYLKALHSYLEASPNTSLKEARKLGDRAVDLELGILELAKIHEEALSSLFISEDESQRYNKDLFFRTGDFFSAVIEKELEDHRSTAQENLLLQATNETFNRRVKELTISNEKLEREKLKLRIDVDAIQQNEKATGKLLKKSHQSRDESRSLSHQLILAQENERKRISRDLHDFVISSLMSINLRLAALVSQEIIDPKELKNRILTSQLLVDESLNFVRKFARQLRPSDLDDIGLIPALQTHFTRVMDRTGIRFSISTNAGIEKLDIIKRTTLFRISQEAIRNIERHSEASAANVIIYDKNNLIHMEIQDNGKGFDVAGVMALEVHERLGLLGMRERAELVGGRFSVESILGESTTIRVEIPSHDINPAK